MIRTCMIKTRGKVEKPMLCSCYRGKLYQQGAIGFGIHSIEAFLTCFRKHKSTHTSRQDCERLDGRDGAYTIPSTVERDKPQMLE